MPKRDMNDLLKKRMSATQQAAEIVVGDEAYETLFRGAPAPEASRFCDLPIDRLRPFFTADIGFHPYSPESSERFHSSLPSRESTSVLSSALSQTATIMRSLPVITARGLGR